MSSFVRWCRLFGLAVCLAVALVASPAGAISIDFDYSYDSSGLFNNPDAVAAMEEAGTYFEPLFDSLAAISPSGSNWWDAGFYHPSTGVYDLYENNLNVPANTLVVFVGGRNFSGSTLGQGGFGGWSGSGSQSWIDKLWSRGEGSGTESAVFGPSAYEFGPWGGSIAFDTPNNWSFDIDDPPTGGDDDFLSVAIHELGHVLGFGTASSFDNLVQAPHRFVGTESKSVYGASYVPLHTDDSHWANGTTSPPSGAETSMDPSITTGTRKVFTPLDYAGLADLGWDVPNDLMYPVISPGDFDFDGDVDGNDFLIWQSNFGGPGPDGDADGDNDVDGNDFLIWQENFGSGDGAGSAQPAAAPEPATGLLAVLLLGAAGMASAGRSRRGRLV